MRDLRRLVASTTALALGAGLLLLGAPAASAATIEPDVPIEVTVPSTQPTTPGETTITNAQLRWGLNRESGGGAFAGGCNFLSAGVAGDAGGARVWSASDGLYSASTGAVRIERVVAGGGWQRASF